ncbi:type II toxin-antitoxin system VapC family toxin [soil metagenome]
MTSVDTNILVYAHNVAAPEHPKALAFLTAHLEGRDFALSKLILLEFYNLLRNPAVFPRPLSATDAVETIQNLRNNPYWTILKATTDVSDAIWTVAADPSIGRRAIFDARIAYSLAAEGVKRFATRNVTDFDRFATFVSFDPLKI